MFESESAISIHDADGEIKWAGYIDKSLVSEVHTTLEGKVVGLVKGYLVEFFEITGVGLIELSGEGFTSQRIYLAMAVWEPINGEVQT